MTLTTDQNVKNDHGAAIGYRPEIDGLRALAVLSVLFYHAGFGLPGGYIGVDVFFVISGYLITSIIVRDCEQGRFRFIDFWERRVRRIAPALYVVVAATLLTGGYLALSDDFREYGVSTLWQLGFLANIHFWETTNYFSSNNDNPLLHTWSLAVEEQFYFVLPLLIFVVYWLNRSRQTLCWLFLFLFAASLWFATERLHLGELKDAFYLLPSRAWELLAGSMIAILPSHWAPKQRVAREGFGWLGVVLIGLPIFLYHDRILFPGLMALAPCLGATLVIWSQIGAAPTVLMQLLSWRPLVFIGLISYSLYLWHWPVWIFANYWSFEGAPSLGFSLGVVVASFILAILSWWWVETPFRKRTVCASRRSLFYTFGASTALLALCAGSIAVFNGMPGRFAEDAAAHEQIIPDEPKKQPQHVVRLKRKKSQDDWMQTSAEVMLIGDSHAKYSITAFDRLCKMLDVKGVAATNSATAPLFREEAQPSILDNRKRFEFIKRVERYIQQNRGQLKDVILIAYWSIYLNEPGFEERFEYTLRSMAEAGIRVWVVHQMPESHVHVPDYLIRALYRDAQPALPEWLMTEAEHQKRLATMYRLAKMGLPATFIDPAPALLIPGTPYYRVEENGISLYRDANHLSSNAISKYVLPEIKKAFAKRP